MPALAQAESNRLLDATFAKTVYVAPSGGVRLALMTTNGNATVNGTEVVGGSYARQTLTMNAASGGQISNLDPINFTNMPAVTVTGVEVWDNGGTPRRQWYGALTTSRTTAAGDTLSFSAASVVGSLA